MTELTPEQKANALFSIYTSAGLQVILEIIEDIALESETALLNAQPWSDEVVGLHAVGHAQRVLFNEVQRRIKYMVEEGRLPESLKVGKRSLEDRAASNAEPPILFEN